jgi:hypothetical protein
LQAIGRLKRHPKANAIMLQVGHEVLWQRFDNLTTPTKAGQKGTILDPAGFECSLLHMLCCRNHATT